MATKMLSLMAAGVLALTVAPQRATASTETAPVAAAIYECSWVAPGAWCAETLTNLNLRTAPHLGSHVRITMPRGSDFKLDCWVRGDPVNGDRIWYRGIYWQGSHISPTQWPNGYAAGFYLNTGHDPHPDISTCPQ